VVRLAAGLQEGWGLTHHVWAGMVRLQALLALDRDLSGALHTVRVVGQHLYYAVGTDELGLKFSRLSASPTVAHHPDPVAHLVQRGRGSSESSVRVCHCWARSASWALLMISIRPPTYSCTTA